MNANFEAGFVDACHKAYSAWIRKKIEARTAHIHAGPLVSALLLSVDFETFAFQGRPQYPFC
jgi:hypothetical protein